MLCYVMLCVMLEILQVYLGLLDTTGSAELWQAIKLHRKFAEIAFFPGAVYKNYWMIHRRCASVYISEIVTIWCLFTANILSKLHWSWPHKHRMMHHAQGFVASFVHVFGLNVMTSQWQRKQSALWSFVKIKTLVCDARSHKKMCGLDARHVMPPTVISRYDHR